MTGTRRPGNLPAAFTSYVGGRQQVDKVSDLVEASRLVTLTGAGGIGKTRLALEAAARMEPRFADGVWFVDLAPLREPAALEEVVATALRMPEQGMRPVMEWLARYLAERRTLIVLDNCEHLADACARLAQALLRAAPELRILATSRHTLGLTGEHVFTVPSLTPGSAARLLEERAGAVRPGFRVTSENQAEVTRLCADLDGLPLAIELAASRLRTLTVKQVTDRLEDRFALLSGSGRIRPPHQNTLHGTIMWSYELCAPAERLLWNRLTVFAGGFDLEAAEDVCADPSPHSDIARPEVLDLLDRLVAQSVVLTCEVDGLPRYRLLASIRQYGRERLTESGEERELLRRHQAFFLALARRVDRHWYGADQAENLARLRAEHPNLLVALTPGTDPRARCALAAALSWHWFVGGFLNEGRAQLDRALAAAPEPTPERARALFSAAWLAQTQGDLAAADRFLNDAEELGERLDDPWVRAQVGGFRGVSANYRGQLGESISRYEEALHATTVLGDEREAASWLLALACVQAYAGDPRAAETGGQLVSAAEESGERWGRAQVLLALGHAAWSRGEAGTAEALARSALECMRDFNDHAMVARMLELLAWATADRGGHERAAGLLGAAAALWQDAGSSLSAFGPRMADDHTRCAENTLAALGRTSYTKLFEENRRLCGSPGRAVAYALSTDREPAGSSAPKRLTSREREVAALVAAGMTNRQIAGELVVSSRTVEGHVENIRAKLGLARRTQLATWWATDGAHIP
ncbi:LuxR family transcriptional regulator [Streptomyces sp. S3(2020)]|nr:LuxR C-terminal-related transcriptional regulator [Streptomyces sp. S3(2020)]NNN33800.1 LuxR family transcriptional regulator [Streptomyces sp. S3(2020)]